MQAFLEDVIKPYMTAPPDGVVVECDLDGPGVTLDVDRSLLSQAFVNLIENALQAMPGGGHLLMTATRSGSDSFQVVLADTGIGMDREALARAFEPYFSTKGTGTGLGMAIARRAIEEHRGRIDLTSAPGQGTTVKVTLPMQPPA
jgi:signal transduction histidine kinase